VAGGDAQHKRHPDEEHRVVRLRLTHLSLPLPLPAISLSFPSMDRRIDGMEEEEERRSKQRFHGRGRGKGRLERAALLLSLFHQLIKSLYHYVQNCRFQWREHLLTLNQLLVFMNGIVRSVSSIISFLYSIIASVKLRWKSTKKYYKEMEEGYAFTGA